MKSNFKYIIISIIGALIIVFFFQLFWLKNLYTSIEHETSKAVKECLVRSNIIELESRIHALDKDSETKKSKREISVTQSFGDEKKDIKSDKETITTEKRFVQKGDTISKKEEELNDNMSLLKIENLGNLLRETIHQTIDTILPIQLDSLHYALTQTFLEKGIKSNIYKIENINFEQNSIIGKYEAKINSSSSSHYSVDYVYDTANNLGYRVFMDNLTTTVLSQMLGILVTTALIILILSVAFWYLIKTIFEQKNLDEMKDDFTNNMTHELKTPIAVAYAATDALLHFAQAENKERREKYLQINKEQLEKLESLVEQILSMSMERRLTLTLKKETIDLKSMIEVIAEQHKIKNDKTKKTIDIYLNISPEQLFLHADKTHINNILNNLVDNAIKYSKAYCKIDITAYAENKMIVIKIRDNGIGIEKDKQNLIFEKFYRVPQGNKHNAKGYGIGLFYVKTIVEKHKGTILVESTLNKGTEFTIKLPQE